ncbi:MAG: hypothetical protein KJ566_02830 [Nanoarchaeota archaeon]|nr:hypothetical protein [Nanoarchaeota archaeon]
MQKINKEHKEKIMKEIEKANNEEYETSWNEKGLPVSKKKSEIQKGKQSRAQGAKFELKVRTELESQGWIMDKWTNNVDLEENKIVKAKRKYNPFKKMLVVGTGFPDFIAFKKVNKNYEIIGVESKMNGTLSKIEKEKCVWYLKNKIFSKILIAKKGEKRGEIEHLDFKERFPKFFA